MYANMSCLIYTPLQQNNGERCASSTGRSPLAIGTVGKSLVDLRHFLPTFNVDKQLAEQVQRGHVLLELARRGEVLLRDALCRVQEGESVRGVNMPAIA